MKKPPTDDQPTDEPLDDETTDPMEDKTAIVMSDTFKGRLAEADRAPPTLLCILGPAGYLGKQWPVTSKELVIGRAIESDIFVDDRSVSKAHAKLLSLDLAVALLDLESTNKSLVNGEAVPPLVPLRLKNGDQIKMGNVIFKFLAEGNIETVSSRDTYDRAHKDPLTGINNRGALTYHGQEIFKRSVLMSFAISVVIFDLDHFKNINSQYTHVGGDYVLKELTSIIQPKLIRTNDFFARYGGEEFVVVLHQSGLNQAMEIAERIRHTVEQHEFTYQEQKIPVTVSVGVATRDPQMSSWEELFEKSDKALFVAKNSGRNKVVKL